MECWARKQSIFRAGLLAGLLAVCGRLLLPGLSTAQAAEPTRAAEPASAEEPGPAGEAPARAQQAADRGVATKQAARQTADDSRTVSLIQALGNPSFSVRQRASRQLVETGIATQPLLTQALDNDDAEIRNRAAQVLRQVLEADFRTRLEAFANDAEGKSQHGLPSWDRFRLAFGDDKPARSLFVEMQRAEPGLLAALESNDKLAGELLVLRVQSVLQSIQWPQLNGGSPPSVSLGSVCTALFVSSSDGVMIGDQDASQLYNLINQPAFQSNLKLPGNSALLRKLLGMWIVHNSGSSIAYQNLMLAFNFDLQEGLDVAIKLIGGDGGGQPYMKQYVILAIGRFGNHEHIALVEPLLKDTSLCMPQQTNDPKQSQIRDVALAVLVRLSGQELKDYGLEHVPTNSQMVFQPGMVTFGDTAKRDAALKKWHEWSAQHQPAKK
jgi:hypothetical protein